MQSNPKNNNRAPINTLFFILFSSCNKINKTTAIKDVLLPDKNIQVKKTKDNIIEIILINFFSLLTSLAYQIIKQKLIALIIPLTF